MMLRLRSEYPFNLRLSVGLSIECGGAECGTWSTAVSTRGADERRAAGDEAESLLSARREAVRGRSACCCVCASALPSLAPRRASLSSALLASANFGWAAKNSSAFFGCAAKNLALRSRSASSCSPRFIWRMRRDSGARSASVRLFAYICSRITFAPVTGDSSAFSPLQALYPASHVCSSPSPHVPSHDAPGEQQLSIAFSDGAHFSHVSSPSSRAALDSMYDTIVLCVPASLETAEARRTLPDAFTALPEALCAAERAPSRGSMGPGPWGPPVVGAVRASSRTAEKGSSFETFLVYRIRNSAGREQRP